MNETVISFFREKTDVYPFLRALDLERFLIDNLEEPGILPVPSKLFLVDESEPRGYAFPLVRSPAMDELESRFQKWLDEEVLARTDSATPKTRVDEAFRAYRQHAGKIAQNALQSSILADYHTIFWLVHSQQVARAFSKFPRHAMSLAPNSKREQNDVLKYVLFAKWSSAIRALIPEIVGQGAMAPGLDDQRLRFVHLLAENLSLRPRSSSAPISGSCVRTSPDRRDATSPHSSAGSTTAASRCGISSSPIAFFTARS